ncbi:MAG: PepSY domain-containing protein [Rhodoferax sp.]|nr:PepSY domain-containing protein [Rhodoferax sp.]
MTTLIDSAPERKPSASRFYAIAWRWHFYAGLYVAPFLIMLALTGLAMVFFTGFQTRLGMTVHVTPQNQVQAVTVQAKAALDAFPGATLNEYVAPPTRDVASWFAVTHAGVTEMVAVDPYTATVIKTVDKDSTVFAWAEQDPWHFADRRRWRSLD